MRPDWPAERARADRAVPQGRRLRRRWLIAAFGAVIGLVVVFAAVLPGLALGSDAARNLVVDRLESLTGRHVSIDGRIDFSILPRARLSLEHVRLGDDDFTDRPFTERRAALVEALAGVGPMFHVTPATTDLGTAGRWFDEFEGAGLDGVIAKPLEGRYLPDKRVMFKIKHARTADCVVAGYRLHKSGADAIGSVLLGLYRGDGRLASVGVIGAFPMARRRELFTELQPLVTTFDEHPWNWAAQVRADPELGRRYGGGSRWNAGKDLSFVPLRPERVVEVRYDHMEGERFRHTAQFNRWRPDRDPRSCTYEQLERPLTFRLDDIVPGLGAPGHHSL